MRSLERPTRGRQPEPCRTARRQPLLFALEPRMMFDGAAVATAAHSVHTSDMHAGVAAKSIAAAPVMDHASMFDKIAAAPTVTVSGRLAQATPANSNATGVLVVDSRIPDYQQVVNAANPGVKVVVLNLNEDGVEQIADSVAGMHDIRSISIVAHGDKGVVLLGNDSLCSGDIITHAAALRAIGNTLSPNGDILLYGCNVGSGSEGKAFLDSLAAVTGASIAASTDNTGGADLGGNWNLEIATGTIGSAPVLNIAELNHYDHLLITTSVSTVAQLKTAIATGNTDGVDDVITITGNLTFASSADAITINVTDGHTMTIVGGGHTLDAAYYARALNVTAGSIAVQNLTITHGAVWGNGGSKGIPAGNAGGSGYGGAIRNAGTLTLTDVTITQNIATGGGGGGGDAGFTVGGSGGGGSGAGGHVGG